MNVIGITGGIGSGKSTVTGLLHEKYFLPVIDADALARKVTENPDTAMEIGECISRTVIDKYGRIDRRRLADIVFNDEETRNILNGIVHPKVRQLFASEIAELNRSGYKCVVYDCPLLIEANLQNDMNVVVLVYAAEKKRIDRIGARSHLSEEEVSARIFSQMKLEEKTKYADYVVYNDGDMADLEKSINMLYDWLVKDGIIDTCDR